MLLHIHVHIHCVNKNRGKYAIKKNYLETLLQEAEDGHEYQWISEYSNNNKDFHTIRHLTCNREYEVKPNDFQQGYRCPHCAKERTESKNIIDIKEYFIKHNIEFETEVKFKGCKSIQLLPFDFYLPDYNLLIEYDGQQHFKPTFGTIIDFKKQRKRDLIKNEFVKEHEISLLRLKYGASPKDYIKVIDNILNNKLKFVTQVKYLYIDAETEIILNENTYYM